MARYINENDIYKLFEDSRGIIRLHVAQIDELPRADVVKVKHGYWEEREDSYFCSECGSENCYAFCKSINKFTDLYCPYCGAIMDGKKEVN